jgi:hypothetical protein
MKRLRTLKTFQIFKTEILKNQKPIAMDVLFKARSMVPSQADPLWPDGAFKYFSQTVLPIIRGLEEFLYEAA